MELTLVFSTEFKNKLDTVNSEVLSAWNSIGLKNTDDVMNSLIRKINLKYPKMNVVDYRFQDIVEVEGESSTYFGYLEDELGRVLVYVFAIPPFYKTRSGVIAQQVFPVMSGILSRLSDSKLYKVTNKPILMLDINEQNHTPSMVLNSVCGTIIGFYEITLFDWDYDSILNTKGIFLPINDISSLNNAIIITSTTGTNEFFEIDIKKKSIKFLKIRLKDGIHVNNEPYWFVLKAYAATYLAYKEGYKIDMSDIETLSTGNKTLDAFREYISRLGR